MLEPITQFQCQVLLSFLNMGGGCPDDQLKIFTLAVASCLNSTRYVKELGKFLFRSL